MKNKGRRRRGHYKKERERKLGTQKSHSQHLAKKMVDVEWILLHFGSISESKMDKKSNQNLIRRKMPSQINPNGVSEIDPIWVDRG